MTPKEELIELIGRKLTGDRKVEAMRIARRYAGRDPVMSQMIKRLQPLPDLAPLAEPEPFHASDNGLILQEAADGHSVVEIAARHGVDRQTVYRVLNGKTRMRGEF